MKLRVAGPPDVDALVALVESAYRGDSSRAGWTTEADLLGGQRTDRDLLAAELADPATTILGLEKAGALLGCCAVRIAGDRASFGTFAVSPTRQGDGLGSTLLGAAEQHARAAGATTLELSVIVQRTDLIAFYERRGFSRTGALLPFPYGDERYGLPRRPDLAFAQLAKKLL